MIITGTHLPRRTFLRGLGASIARMEGRVAFETLLTRTEQIEWAGPPAMWAPATALRTLEAFPVRLTPA